MVREYVERLYLPAAAADRAISAKSYQPARDLAAWKARVTAAWPEVPGGASAAPFWLPQGLWEGLILGPRALPSSFVDTFLGLSDLIRFHHERTVGIWLPLAAILLVVVARARLSLQFAGHRRLSRRW